MARRRISTKLGPALALVCGVLLGALLESPARSAPPEPPVPPCLRVWAEARLRALGFDHVVHLENACTAEAVCTVATDVDPAPIAARVPARGATEVITRIGSPSRELSPAVKCRLVAP